VIRIRDCWSHSQLRLDLIALARVRRLAGVTIGLIVSDTNPANSAP